MIEIISIEKGYIVCQKPSGLLSEECDKPNMVTELKKQLGSSIFPVHRLDKDTSGLMVYALDSKAAAFFSEQIRSGNFHKKYIAVLSCAASSEGGEMNDLLYYDRTKNKSYVVKRERSGVKKASLSWEKLFDADGKSIVLISLQTGRTHQIRVQFASRKMPLDHDRKYGGTVPGKIMLHCCELSFQDHNGNCVSFTSYPDWPEYQSNFEGLSRKTI